MTHSTRRLPLILALLGLFFLLAVLALAATLGGRPGAGSAASAAQNYTRLCAGCHGAMGEGNAAIPAPAINAAGESWRLRDSAITAILNRGYGKMPAATAQLSAVEVQALNDYVKGWWTSAQRAQQP